MVQPIALNNPPLMPLRSNACRDRLPVIRQASLALQRVKGPCYGCASPMALLLSCRGEVLDHPLEKTTCRLLDVA